MSGDYLPLLIVPAVFALVLVLAHFARQRNIREIRALADGLERGWAGVPTGIFDGLSDCNASGELDGHAVRVGFEQRGSGKHKYHVAILNVTVHHPAASFQIDEAGVLDRLGRWLGLSKDELGDGDLVLRQGRDAAKRLMQAGGVKRALRRVLDLDGVSGVRLDGTTLRIERRAGSVDAASLRRALEAMVELARRCGRVAVEVKVSERLRGKVTASPRFAWTDGGSHACCPYCKDAIDPTGADTTGCARCGTVHHTACLEEAGGCTIFGCGSKAEAGRARA